MDAPARDQPAVEVLRIPVLQLADPVNPQLPEVPRDAGADSGDALQVVSPGGLLAAGVPGG